MLDWTFVLTMLWLAGLILMLMLYMLRTSGIANRVVGFDSLSTLFVAALAVIAIQRRDAFYLDIALVVAMLAFTQTVATVRLLERRSELQ